MRWPGPARRQPVGAPGYVMVRAGASGISQKHHLLHFECLLVPQKSGRLDEPTSICERCHLFRRGFRHSKYRSDATSATGRRASITTSRSSAPPPRAWPATPLEYHNSSRGFTWTATGEQPLYRKSRTPAQPASAARQRQRQHRRQHQQQQQCPRRPDSPRALEFK